MLKVTVTATAVIGTVAGHFVTRLFPPGHVFSGKIYHCTMYHIVVGVHTPLIGSADGGVCF